MIAAQELYPRRIVCLTEEPTEILYRLGHGDRVVGISGYTVRPPEARLKPKVSAFTSANLEKICALEPDLVIGFSDLQAGIASALIKRGLQVLIFNQRTVQEILGNILMMAGLVGGADRGEALVNELRLGLQAASSRAASLPVRPRVFFEEWMDPLISGISWVEELVTVAGGDSIFPGLGNNRLAKDRIVEPSSVLERDPQVIIASWCGKRVRPNLIRQRAGWQAISAVRHDRIFEIKSALILQPGPAALTDGLSELERIISAVSSELASPGVDSQ